MRCVIIEDEKLPRIALRGLLNGHEVKEAQSFSEAKELLSTEYFDVAFIDLDLDKKLAGLELAQIAKSKGIYSIITTGHTENEIIHKAYELGCQDYLTKPITEKALNIVLKRHIAFDSEDRVDSLISKNYITQDPKTLNELNIIKKISLTDKPILIKGPSGTGKRVVAHIIRETLKLPKNKFVEINCAQFSESLIESELFGHKKGAFTGADRDKTGLLTQADNGVIFLDEIHSLTKRAQQKLMKAIEEKEFFPVGSSKPIRSNFKVICATCEDLIALISENKFRPDFYARISSMQLELFPLKDRKCDILPLVKFYNEKYSRKISITEDAEKVLLGLEWVNNTRDIESLVEYWHIHGLGIISPNDIPKHFKTAHLVNESSSLSKREIKKIQEMGMKEYLDVLRLQIVESFVEISNGNQREAAAMLGCSKQLVGKILNQKRDSNFERGFEGESVYEEHIQ
ncbi:MAG: sigma-54-dependent Fis family transcriptional regulator [Halobacteriovoraceae bacterium]|nr:sigma-54-dependent Fis family transcriptional regulator [Halobacteriovoraceae bacterium]MCB9093489.1 sigma-54-dependent Fis family transcriptional regulator [Halobacteriovoraceae bacterium]